MTVQELRQLFYLDRMIEIGRERIAALRSAAAVQSPGFSDAPRAPGAHDRIGHIVPAIVDEEAALAESIRQCEQERARLLTYIRQAPNTRLRLILTLRFIDRKSWQEVADTIGGRETEYSVKQACYRYVGERK